MKLSVYRCFDENELTDGELLVAYVITKYCERFGIDDSYYWTMHGMDFKTMYRNGDMHLTHSAIRPEFRKYFNIVIFSERKIGLQLTDWFMEHTVPRGGQPVMSTKMVEITEPRAKAVGLYLMGALQHTEQWILSDREFNTIADQYPKRIMAETEYRSLLSATELDGI